MNGVQPKLNSVCVTEAKTKCEQNTEPQNESFMRRAGSTIFNGARSVAKGVGNVAAGVCDVAVGVCDVAVGVCDVAASAVGVVGDAVGFVGDIFRSDEADQDKKTKGLDLES